MPLIYAPREDYGNPDRSQSLPDSMPYPTPSSLNGSPES